MNGRQEQIILEGRTCTLWIPAGAGPWPAAYLCGGDMRERIGELAKNDKDLLLFSVSADWEREYTPWPTPSLPNRAPFTGGAAAHLRFLTETAKPWADAHLSTRPEPQWNGLLGYSLGGLFALWALCQTETFGLIAGLSGSLWYDGWPEYMRANRPNPAADVYLSLGKAEERGGGPQMRTVGERTRQTAELLKERLGPERVTLEWNRGGCFTGILNRWEKALRWAADTMKKKEGNAE